MLLIFLANQAEDLPFKQEVTAPEGECCTSSLSTRSAIIDQLQLQGLTSKNSQQMHESTDQGLTLPTLLRCAAKAEELLINSIFPYKVSHHPYL